MADAMCVLRILTQFLKLGQPALYPLSHLVKPYDGICADTFLYYRCFKCIYNGKNEALGFEVF